MILIRASMLIPVGLAAQLATACSQDPPAPAESSAHPQDAFFEALSTHCGKAYSGALVSSDEPDAQYVGADMVIHFSDCSENRIAIAFQAELDGMWDRSRTWIITRTRTGLDLEHDHREVDGSPAAISGYSGITADPGTPRQQDFPVDDETSEYLMEIGYCASTLNTWTMEVDPAGTENAQFAYQLFRPVTEFEPDHPLADCPGAAGGRFFRAEFDLTQEIETPLPAWGAG